MSAARSNASLLLPDVSHPDGTTGDVAGANVVAQSGAPTTTTKAVAIFGPRASPSDAQAFFLPGVELRCIDAHDDAALDSAFAAPLHAALIFGGDGTIHFQLPRLLLGSLPFLPVPHGSGNDFAANLGFLRPADSLVAWKAFCASRKNVRDIDLGFVTNASGVSVPFCNIAGVGLDAEANALANRMPPWLRAHGGYFLAVFAAVLRFHPPLISLSVSAPVSDGSPAAPTTLSQPAWLLSMANAPSYGGGFRIAPRAQMDDGILDLCLVRATGKLRLLRLFPTLLSGRHVLLKEVSMLAGAAVHVETRPPLAIFGDGEFICYTPADATVHSRALRVIVPAARP